jgi:serine/threonine protein kinase
LAHENIIRY